jgi:hypothetical protein
MPVLTHVLGEAQPRPSPRSRARRTSRMPIPGWLSHRCPLTGGTAGKCLFVVAGQVAHGACTASSAPCGLDGKCDGAGACRPKLKTGDACSDPASPCITGPTCQTGACTGGTQILCNNPPACKQSTTCSAGNCNYTQNVPDGILDSNCPGSTPRCYSGGCVQCTSDAHCTLPTVSCKPSTHTCVCRLPSSGNLLTNPGFDGSLSGWTINSNPPSPTLGADSDGCTGSNSLYAPNSENDPMQCVSLTAGTTYYMGGRFKGGDSNDLVRMRLCTGPSCTGTCDINYDVYMGASASWTIQHTSFVTPAGYVSGYVGIYALGDQYVDQLYVSKTSDSY